MDDHSDSSSVESTSAEVATVTPNCPLSPIPENLVETVRKSCHVSCSFVYILIALTEQSWLRIIKVI